MSALQRVPVVAAAVALLGLSACGGDGSGKEKSAKQQGGSPAAEVGKPEGLLEWMAAHPENAGLVVLEEGGKADIELNADSSFPLASTRKVLIVGALAQSGSLAGKVPRSAVERFYAPGTDGGAHEKAALEDPLTLEKIALAAIVVSDNAAADALLERIGPERVDAYAEQQGMAKQDPIYPILGELAAWSREPEWTSLSPDDRARRANELAGTVPAKEVKAPSVADQRRLAAKSVAGTPAEWARLMGNISRDGDPQLVRVLDWPRRKSPEVAKSYTRFLSKGGSLPGVITEAAYVQPRGRPGVAMALFLRDLPSEVETTLQETFAQQKLLSRLASDPAFREKAGEMLAK